MKTQNEIERIVMMMSKMVLLVASRSGANSVKTATEMSKVVDVLMCVLGRKSTFDATANDLLSKSLPVSDQEVSKFIEEFDSKMADSVDRINKEMEEKFESIMKQGRQPSPPTGTDPSLN